MNLKSLIAVSLYLSLSLMGADQNAPENVKAAFDKVKASAEEGNADNQVHLAWWYYIGSLKYGYPKKDYKLEIFWLRKAADQNHPEALRKLAYYHLRGFNGLKKDHEKSVELYMKAWQAVNEAADKDEAKWKGEREWIRKQLGNAFRIYLPHEFTVKYALDGNPHACFALHIKYSQGKTSGGDVKADPVKSKYWALMAAECGDAYHMFQYSLQLNLRDPKMAEWTLKAAEKGYVPAMESMGASYSLGWGGLLVDHKKSFEWHSKAVNRGSVNSMSNLASLYLEGKGVYADKKKGFGLLQKYITQYQPDGFGGMFDFSGSFTSALVKFGSCYENGDGVLEDFVTAYAWYSLADFYKEPSGKAKLAKNLLREKMTAEQVAKAQELSKELLKTMEAKKSPDR